MIFKNFNYTHRVDGNVHDYQLVKELNGSPICLDFKFINNKSSVLVVVFSGAYNKPIDKTLPFYTALKFADKIDQCSFLFISDPALYVDGIQLGWYLGSHSLKLQEVLPDFIKFFVNKAEAERLVFFGGSGGGFASLYYSSFFEDSLSIIWNPQTNVKLYNIKNYKHIDSFSEAMFGVDRSRLSEYCITNMVSFYANHSMMNKVIYLQNITDHHVARDLKPFYEKNSVLDIDLSKPYSDFMSKNIYLHLTNWSMNHPICQRSCHLNGLRGDQRALPRRA